MSPLGAASLDARRPERSRPGPLALLLACLLPVIGAFDVTRPRTGLIVLAADVVLLGWLVVDAVGSLLRLAAGSVAALTLGLTTWLYAGHDLDRSAATMLRILCIALPAALLSPAIRPSALGDQLAQRVRLPARPVAAAVAALQRVETFGDQWRVILRARRARGVGMDGGPVRRVRVLAGAAFTLLVAAMRQSGQLATAMDARGFATAQHRTWAGDAPWRAADWLVLAFAVVLAALPFLL